jgi:hypothetical protein
VVGDTWLQQSINWWILPELMASFLLLGTIVMILCHRFFKPRDIQPNKRNIHLNKVKYCVDTFPTQQAHLRLYLLGSRNGIRLSKGGTWSCVLPFFVFFRLPSRSSPSNLVLYGSGLAWSCVDSLCQSSEVGPGYYFYLGGLVGFDEGGHWVVSLLY